MNKKNVTALMNNILNLPTDDLPIKKTGATTVAKQKIEDGTAVFNGIKNVNIVFGTSFTKSPLVQLTMLNSGSVPAYKTVTTITGFSIKFQINWTGEVDWVATERK